MRKGKNEVEESAVTNGDDVISTAEQSQVSGKTLVSIGTAVGVAGLVFFAGQQYERVNRLESIGIEKELNKINTKLSIITTLLGIKGETVGVNGDTVTVSAGSP